MTHTQIEIPLDQLTTQAQREYAQTLTFSHVEGVNYLLTGPKGELGRYCSKSLEDVLGWVIQRIKEDYPELHLYTDGRPMSLPRLRLDNEGRPVLVPTRIVELSAEELALVQRHREEKSMAQAKQTLSIEILKVAAEFAYWLVDNGGDSGFSAFSGSDGFDYEIEKDGLVAEAAELIGCDRTHIYKAACRLIEHADELLSIYLRHRLLRG